MVFSEPIKQPDWVFDPRAGGSKPPPPAPPPPYNPPPPPPYKAAPFDGNLLPPGATGGNIDFNPDGSQHVTVHTYGARISYDRLGDVVSRVHGTIHDDFKQGEDLIVPPQDLGYGH